MCGYQEILTDPSYHFQLVTMTYPQIGNYGVNPKDFESRRIYAAGFIIRELSPIVSHWQATARSTTTCSSTGWWGSTTSTPAPSPGTAGPWRADGHDHHIE